MVQAPQLAIGRERANEIAREVTELKLERTQTLMEGALRTVTSALRFPGNRTDGVPWPTSLGRRTL